MADPDPAVEPAQPDPHFEPSERLFRRIPWTEVESGFVSDASLPSPVFSVNREKYSKGPADVLKDHPGMGIAAFRVGDIPSSIKGDGGELFEFGVEHRPEPGNYAHSEVHSFAGGVRLEDPSKPPRHVRKKFRDLLRQRIQILELASIG
jgi:hypothetical protein